ncbi:MAG: phosphate ABC transporter permease subunit PstC [Rhodothermales bacterium]
MSVSGRIGKGFVVGSTLVSASVIFLIGVFLLLYSWDAVVREGWLLFGGTWNPADGRFGILAMLYGTAAVTAIALVVALPLGLATAVFTAEILPGRYRLAVKSALELLAGIPSIVYGLVAVALVSVWIEDLFALQTGRTVLSAGLILAVMILPTMITLSDDALHHVPRRYREAAEALGLYRFEVVRRAVWPIARTDVAGAALLALGRAMGETMATMLVVGGVDRLPGSPADVLLPGQTITSKLGREMAETAFGSVHFSAMIFMGLVLFVFVLGLTMVALIYFYHPEDRRYV